VIVLDVSLVPVAAPPSPASPVAPVVATTPASPSPASEPAPPRTSPSRSLVAPVATTIGAVVLVGAGIGAFVLAGNAQSNGQNQCAQRTSGGCDDLRAPVRDWDSVALGAWIGSAILATTAVVLWASPPRARSGTTRITTTGSRLLLEGSF
jgi:hypothetical protein